MTSRATRGHRKPTCASHRARQRKALCVLHMLGYVGCGGSTHTPPWRVGRRSAGLAQEIACDAAPPTRTLVLCELGQAVAEVVLLPRHRVRLILLPLRAVHAGGVAKRPTVSGAGSASAGAKVTGPRGAAGSAQLRCARGSDWRVMQAQGGAFKFVRRVTVARRHWAGPLLQTATQSRWQVGPGGAPAQPAGQARPRPRAA